jgi:hypothetical protein
MQYLQGLTPELAPMAKANDILNRMKSYRIQGPWAALKGGKAM